MGRRGVSACGRPCTEAALSTCSAGNVCILVTRIRRLCPEGGPRVQRQDQATPRGCPVKKQVLSLAQQSGPVPTQRCSKPPFLPLPQRDGVPRDQILLGLQEWDVASCFAAQAPAGLWSHWRKGVWLLWGLEDTRCRTHVGKGSPERTGLQGRGTGGLGEQESTLLPLREPLRHPWKGRPWAGRDGEASAAGPILLRWKEAGVRTSMWPWSNATVMTRRLGGWSHVCG